jgi:DHA1 family tetracycline resistance protein-like MFS transporter
MRSTKLLLLIIAFIDYIGVGLIYPMFSSMLFDVDYPLLPQTMSSSARGFYLGLLLAIMPLCQFFSAPFWGALSDVKGRRGPLIYSVALTLVGYIVAFLGTFTLSIGLLFFSRALIGFASGNTSIIQASLADLSPENEKAKNYGLYSMALGSGFTLGPFIGGALSHFGYSTPFLFAVIALVINLIVCKLCLKDTAAPLEGAQFKWQLGLKGLKEVLLKKPLRGTFFASFLHNFGWCYFFEFIPVFLFQVLNFSHLKLGSFYATAGLFYALSAGLLIRPIVDRFKPLTLFQGGLFATALIVLSMGFVSRSLQLWPILFLLCFFVAFVTPSATAFISSKSEAAHQGKTLGALSAMNSLALIVAPLISGSFVGKFPKMPIWLGGSVIFLASVVSFFFQKKDRSSLPE